MTDLTRDDTNGTGAAGATGGGTAAGGTAGGATGATTGRGGSFSGSSEEGLNATLQRTVEDLRAEFGRELNQRTQQVKEWANQSRDTVRTTVVERPFASAGSAFAAGLILGLLLARR